MRRPVDTVGRPVPEDVGERPHRGLTLSAFKDDSPVEGVGSIDQRSRLQGLLGRTPLLGVLIRRTTREQLEAVTAADELSG